MMEFSGIIGWMPTPIDTEHFSPCSTEDRSLLRKERGVGAETPLIIFFGRLEAGPDAVIHQKNR